jgi:multidrug resistance efflux pump
LQRCCYAAFEIVNVNTLKLTVTVNESQVVNLKKGTPITVTSSVYPGQEFNGKSYSSLQKQTVV